MDEILKNLDTFEALDRLKFKIKPDHLIDADKMAVEKYGESLPVARLLLWIEHSLSKKELAEYNMERVGRPLRSSILQRRQSGWSLVDDIRTIIHKQLENSLIATLRGELLEIGSNLVWEYERGVSKTLWLKTPHGKIMVTHEDV